MLCVQRPVFSQLGVLYLWYGQGLNWSTSFDSRTNTIMYTQNKAKKPKAKVKQNATLSIINLWKPISHIVSTSDTSDA